MCGIIDERVVNALQLRRTRFAAVEYSHHPLPLFRSKAR